MSTDAALEALIATALAEDVGRGDWTTTWIVPADQAARAVIVAKADVVLAGLRAAQRTFEQVDPGLRTQAGYQDGDAVRAGAVVLTVAGAVRGILTGERTALNFLARLSGIATLTRRFVAAIAGTGARITDTRKTTPGWRVLEKAAVRCGGGENHRFGLDDMVLVKENHIAAAGGIAEALRRVREANREGLPVEVEVRTLGEFDTALSLGLDRILLDHFDLSALREAVQRTRLHAGPAPQLEASGNVTLATVRAIAETGVDLISIGAITHSAPAADFSLLVE